MVLTRRALALALVVAVLLAAAAPAAGHGKHHHHPRPRSCERTRTCVPTYKDYNNLAEAAPAAFSQWPKCRGPFVLCSVAYCRIIPKSGTKAVPRQAECGCLTPLRNRGVNGISYVTPNIIKSKSVYDATVARCFGGQAPSTANNTCTAVNSAPVCKSINRGRMYGGKWPLISTFALYANQGVQMCTGNGAGTSITADCMTAACYKKRAFDGSPYTCYCPIVSIGPGIRYALGYPRDKHPQGINCTQPDGFAVSGA
ncbi:ABC transporter ATP-binding [Micractinium conductrix]|uniref:ABC transporter ATP-binding n=1 Tax=Micractinium conductrix TaxID=554055 RepID=A0A2P6VSJ0_9CHLO|nr:ABC transporter ATP-binding [Micractinium conductrix]|eukprot:PSC77061.1 ABC transporter ATP-binding [Micractinium conductrix]